MEKQITRITKAIGKLENEKKKLKLKIVDIRDRQAEIKAEIEPLRQELRVCEKMARLSERELEALRDVLAPEKVEVS